MPLTKNSILCPHCQNTISLDEALTGQIEKQYATAYAAKLQKEKETLWIIAQEKAKEKLKQAQESELKLLHEQLQEKNRKLEQAAQIELQMRRDKIKLEEEKRSFELEKQRQLDAERTKIRDEVGKILSEQHQHKDAEKDKTIQDLTKALEDAHRKATQGSQQLQGEVLELEFESLLKHQFPLDTIEPVAKGITGADLLQHVNNRTGLESGIIIWEMKQTKAWTDQWIGKLKEDQRTSKAEVAILVSNILPKDIIHFGQRQGIYITGYQTAIAVAHMIRKALIDVNQVRISTVGKKEKMEILYAYLSGTEFKQRVEAIFEGFNTMREDLEKEKRAMTKIWAKREKQIEQIMENTTGMHGELKGLMGTALPEIKQFELSDVIDEAEIF